MATLKLTDPHERAKPDSHPIRPHFGPLRSKWGKFGICTQAQSRYNNTLRATQWTIALYPLTGATAWVTPVTGLGSPCALLECEAGK